jgi:hypothetical protein
MVLVPLLAAALIGGSPSATLTITVRAQGPAGPAKVWTLRCDPAGGTLPRPAVACRRLKAFRTNPFAATPPGMACTEVYGGPATATVRGTFRGRPVRATFSKRDGCAIARWNRVSFLFPVAVAL